MSTDMLTFFGRLHPLVLHLPIGLLTAALLLEILPQGERLHPQLRIERILSVRKAEDPAVIARGSLRVGGPPLIQEGDAAVSKNVTQSETTKQVNQALYETAHP